MPAELVMGSEQAVALQSSIQRELSIKGYSLEDDTVMAEYITIMLINDKTPDQVTSELTELIGDYDPSFTTWLFKERNNPDILGATGTEPHNGFDHDPPPSSSSQTIRESSPKPHPRSPEPGNRTSSLPSRPQVNQSRPLYQQAISSLPGSQSSSGSQAGQKRTASQRSPSPSGHHPAKRRNPDLPDRPRAMRDEGPTGPTVQRPGRTSLLDRVGPPAPPGAPGPDGMQGRGRPNHQQQPGGPMMHPQMHPQQMAAFAGMDPAAIAMMQQQQQQGFNPGMMGPVFPGQIEATMMAIQQFGQLAVQMGLVPGAMPTGVPPGAPPFNGQPSSNGFQNDRSKRPGPGKTTSADNRKNAPSSGAPIPPSTASNPPPAAPAVVQPTPVVPASNPNIPERPLSPTLCKFVTNCTNPTCRYSHPSPVATKESGVVLSTEPCEAGLNCTDKDCLKAHVSKAAKDPQAVAAVPARAAPAQTGGLSHVPCKFDPHCTRNGCPYFHSAPKFKPKTPMAMPCRFGAGCTRADCPFNHAPGRVLPNQFSKGLNGAPPTAITAKAEPWNRTVDFRNKPAAAVVPEEPKTAEAQVAAPAEGATPAKAVEAA